ncbi:porin family protein [Novosphingobium huizhouense]|uniref:hypothetical protein n=1 Tax=Novosphingobium huizhouense TaxID=2866625 RepID=UPI001CD90732|nr:hypothetical protein [Novosphingobium huizhouense]
MSHRGVRALSLLLALGAAPGAFAQTLDPSALAFDPSGLTFDRPAPRLHIAGAVDAHYDSNVARASDAVTERRNLDKSDFVLSPSINADIVAPTSAATFTLAGSVGYNFYLRNSRLNRERIDLNATAQRRIAICDVGLNAGIARRQTDLGDLQILNDDGTLIDGGEGTIVNTETQWRVGGTISCGAAVGIEPNAYANYRQLRNSAEVRKFNNANVFDYGGGVAYASPAFGRIGVFAGRTDFNYTDRASDPLFAATDRFHYSYIGAKLDRRLGARLQVQGQVTYTRVSVPGRDLSRFDGLNWNIAAQLRVGGSTRVSVATARSIDVSAGFRSDFARTTIYSGKVERALTARTRLTFTALRRERDFAQVQSAGFPLAANDRTDQLGLALGFEKSQRLNFAGYVQGQRRRSDLAALDYDAVQVGLTASLRF